MSENGDCVFIVYHIDHFISLRNIVYAVSYAAVLEILRTSILQIYPVIKKKRGITVKEMCKEIDIHTHRMRFDDETKRRLQSKLDTYVKQLLVQIHVLQGIENLNRATLSALRPH